MVEKSGELFECHKIQSVKKQCRKIRTARNKKWHVTSCDHHVTYLGRNRKQKFLAMDKELSFLFYPNFFKVDWMEKDLPKNFKHFDLACTCIYI